MSEPATAAVSEEGRLGYGRILLKLSGEALLGDRPYGVDPAFCAFIADQVKRVHDAGVQVGIGDRGVGRCSQGLLLGWRSGAHRSGVHRFWQTGQKKVERCPCTMRRIGVPQVRQGSPSRP